ncbi:unnamed protein product [Paramecium sonneborni]|uniref:Uncharacterized protein n=1 Tax=Paramecium sonneborni TaxID=65129 RepID=A0A8S1R7D2_9CILI|nr:unnamed protein product [Paramecium sonneborni]
MKIKSNQKIKISRTQKRQRRNASQILCRKQKIQFLKSNNLILKQVSYQITTTQFTLRKIVLMIFIKLRYKLQQEIFRFFLS